MTPRERLYERLADRFSILVDAGVCGSYTESGIDDLPDWYCDQFSLPDRRGIGPGTSASRVRQRIGELEKDAEILEEHHPKLYRELREAVCDEE